MDKQAREILAAMVEAEDTGSAVGTVDYVPGREHDTNSEARTRWSFQQYRPAPVGFKSHVRVTAPVKRLIAAGYVSDAGGDRRVRLTVTPAGRAALQPAAKPVKPLTPPMESLVRALHEYGYIDPIRDCGRRQGVNTLVALMDRGIIREAKTRRGIHFPTTTPEQVWDEAHAEDARRAAERASTDREDWTQAVDDEGDEMHFRGARSGGLIRIYRRGFQHWAVYVPGQQHSMSAGGTWQEARRAADNFEREQAHAEALVEHCEREAERRHAADEAAAQVADEAFSARDDYLNFWAAFGYGRDLPGDETVFPGIGEQPLQGGRLIDMADMRKHAPVLLDSIHEQALEDDAQHETGWGQPDGMLGATEAELTGARTPAEARTGVSDRAVAALTDVAELRRILEPHVPLGATMREVGDRLDRIEAALRERTV